MEKGESFAELKEKLERLDSHTVDSENLSLTFEDKN